MITTKKFGEGIATDYRRVAAIGGPFCIVFSVVIFINIFLGNVQAEPRYIGLGIFILLVGFLNVYAFWYFGKMLKHHNKQA